MSLRSELREPALAPPGRVSWSEAFVALTAFLALAIGYLRLGLARFHTAVAPDPGDPLFVLSILRWGADQARHGFPDFWNPTFFFPSRGVLALSDHLIGPAIGLALLEGIGLSSAASYNTLLLTAFAGGAFTCYLVLRWSGLAWPGAALAGLVWSFSGFRWQELSHLQVLLALWIPLVLWSFDRLLAEVSPKRALVFLACYLLHISGGAYLAYLVHLPLAALFAVRVRGHGRAWWRGRNLAILGTTAAIAGGTYLALYLPYRQPQGGVRALASFQLVRPFLTGLFSWFEVGSRTFHAQWLPQPFVAGAGGQFLGIVPTLLIVAGALLWLRQRRAEEIGARLPGVHAAGLRVIALVAGLLALVAADVITLWADLQTYIAFRAARRHYYACAAVLVLAGLLWWLAVRRSRVERRPERGDWWSGLMLGGAISALGALATGTMVLRALAPGFASIRVPGRLFIFTSLALAALAGKGLDALLARVGRAGLRRTLAVAALLLVVVELQPVHRFIQWVELPAADEIPPVYRWLAEHDEVRAVLELPMLDYWRESGRLYLWTFHQRPLVNGYSGYLPPGYLERQQKLSVRPEALDLAGLARLGVSHVVIHFDELKSQNRRAFRHWLQAVEKGSAPPLRLVLRTEDAAVVQIADGRSAGTTRRR